MSEQERLGELLEEDWMCLNGRGDVCCDFRTVDVESGGRGRWSEYMTAVTRSERTGEHFMWDYSEGLTEYQDSDYDGSLRPVRPVTKMVEVTEWVNA